jgi:hypothetical protein
MVKVPVRILTSEISCMRQSYGKIRDTKDKTLAAQANKRVRL